jgi:hypothetical protein
MGECGEMFGLHRRIEAIFAIFRARQPARKRYVVKLKGPPVPPEAAPVSAMPGGAAAF